MLVTLSGMFMKVRLLQPKKPNSPMLVTLSGMIVLEHPITSLLLLVSMIALHPFRESYIVFPSATIMEVRPLQLLKAEYSIFVTLFGMLMEVRLLQLEKAELPIFVTLSGIFMEERLLQPEKTELAILVTLSGMFMVKRLLQPLKAELPIPVTLSGIIVFEHPVINVLLLVSIMALQSLRESYIVLPSATIMETRLLQPEEREPPILTTLSGIVMETRSVQPEKA